MQQLVERPSTASSSNLLLFRLGDDAVFRLLLGSDDELLEVGDPAAGALEVELGDDLFDGLVVEEVRAKGRGDESLEEGERDAGVGGEEGRERGGLL